MPYAEAKDYRFNPFDLTKTWSHDDYPLIEVGTLTLNENPANFFAEIDQAAFAPSNIVEGIGFSPDRMLLARVFAYGDAQRARIGVNHDQLPVNRSINEKNVYTFGGKMRYEHSGWEPTYAANSGGRPYADNDGVAEDGWEADGAMLRAAQTLRKDDDDFGQAGTLVREVFDDAARDRFVETVSGALAGVTEPVLERAIWYWKSVDETIGQRIEDAVRANTDGSTDAHPGLDAEGAQAREPRTIRETDTNAAK